jgi:hypothetical protein
MEVCFLFEIKAFFIEHRGYNDLRRTAEGGHDAAANLYAILLYRDNGGATADDTAKEYMRRVGGGGSTTSKWLSNEGSLPLREKAALAIHSSTWRIWGEPLPPLAQMRGDQPCVGTGGGCGVEKGWLQISLFCSEGEPLPPLALVCGDQPCAGTGRGCGVEKGWLQISLFCSEDCRLRCEMVKFAQSIGIANQ